MQVTKNITLDLLETGSPVIIKAKQNDRNTRYIAAHLYVDGLAYPVPSGTEIAFRYKKPDGTAGFYDALPDNSPAITVSGNTVTVELVEQVLTAAGCVHCEINMYNAASEKLTTFTFEISVEESVLTDAEIISSDYYNVLTAEITKALQAVTDATEQAENAAQSAQDAADNAAMSKDWAAGQPVTYSGAPVSIAYAGANRIASITAYGETPQGGTVEAPVALTGVDSVQVCGNNLLPMATEAKTIYGVTFTPNSDGSITVSGTATGGIATYNFADGLDRAMLGQTVFVSGAIQLVRVIINEKTAEGAFARNVIVDRGQGASGILTKQKDSNILYATLQVQNGDTVNHTIYPMLNLGSTAMPYEPYQGSVTTLPIPRPLRRVGDVKDVCVTRVKSVYDKRIVLDGSEDWTEYTNENWQGAGYHVYMVRDADALYGQYVASNKYPSRMGANNFKGTLGVATGIQLILFSVIEQKTVDDWKAYLAAQKAAGTPLIIYRQSTAYDGTNGLDVCLTEYMTGFAELDGKNVQAAYNPNDGRPYGVFNSRNIIKTIDGVVCSQAKTEAANLNWGYVYAAHLPIRDIIFGLIGSDITSITELNAYLAAQKAAGTPVQVAYQLATPETYATDPVDFDNAAGPLTVMTGGEVEVRMTELVGTRSPELTGKMDRDIYFQVGNLNLGDNTNLLNPVNQQGQASYTGDSTSPYCIDRWRISNGTTYNIVSRTLTASSYANRACGMWQTNELAQQALAIGSTITFSGYINGMQHSGTIKILNRDLYSSFAEVPAGYECDDFEIVCCTASHEQSKYNLGIYPKKEAVLNWIKWEKGLYATPYAPKGFGLEQLECMRYYQTIKGIKYVLRKALASEGFPYVIPVTFMPMRAVPQTDITVTEGAENNLTATGVTQTACGIQFQPVAENVGLTFTLTLSANL